MAANVLRTRIVTAVVIFSFTLLALFLFPSNIGAETKREGIARVWGWSGEVLNLRWKDIDLVTNVLIVERGKGEKRRTVEINEWLRAVR